MLMLVALMAQTPVLDADPYVAGRTCAVAAKDQPGVPDGLPKLSRSLFYLLHAARARATGGTLLARYMEAGDGTLPTVSPKDADALLAQCETRFPRARSVGPAQLPAKPLDRNAMCFSVLSLLGPVAEEIEEKDARDPWSVRLKSAMEPVMRFLSEDEKTRKPDSAELMALWDRQFSASIDLSDPLTVAFACGLKAD